MTRPLPTSDRRLEYLRCPTCARQLAAIGDTTVECLGGHVFPVRAGVPMLLDGALLDLAEMTLDASVNTSDHLNWKRMQFWYHDEENAATERQEYESRRPYRTNRLFEYLVLRELDLAHELIGSLDGQRVLSVCGGRGLDAEYCFRHGASVSLTDLVLSSVEIAKLRFERLGAELESFCADAEALPVTDRSFDVCVAHDALHHLPKPFECVREMGRIARRAVVVIEPNDSPLTRLTRSVGLTSIVEKSGNHKYYFRSRELERALRSEGYSTFHAAYSFQKKFHFPPRAFSTLSRAIPFHAIRLAQAATSKIAGSWSNHLVFVAMR